MLGLKEHRESSLENTAKCKMQNKQTKKNHSRLCELTALRPVTLSVYPRANIFTPTSDLQKSEVFRQKRMD